MKKILLRLKGLFFIVLLLIPSTVYADTTVQDQGSLIEQLIAAPIEGIYKALQLFGFKSYNDLIFNTSQGVLAPFTSDEWNIAMTWYSSIRDAVWVMLVISIIIAGYRLQKSGNNPNSRAEVMRKSVNIIYAFTIIIFMPYFIQLIFMANNALVDLFKNIAQNAGVLNAKGFDINDIHTGNVIATAVVKLGYEMLIVFFNFLYTIRKFVLISMFALTPIVAWSWTISGRYEGIGVILGEIASNAFMQAAHAFVLSLYLALISSGVKSDFSTWWAQMFGMVVLIPAANVIRNLLQGWLQFLGVNEEGWAGLATMALGGLAGLTSIAKTMIPAKIAGGIVSGNNVIFGGNPDGGGGGNGGGSNTSGFGGTPAPSGSFNRIISNGIGVGNTAGKIGSALGAVVGAAAGIPFGAQGMKNLSELGNAIGGGFSAGITRMAATGHGLFKEAVDNSKYSGEPGAVYTDKSGEGMIKAVRKDDGTMKYYLPGQEDYDSIKSGVLPGYNSSKIKLFKTEDEAQSAGYEPAHKRSFTESLKSVMGTKNAADTAASIIGAVGGSAFGPAGTKVGSKLGQYGGLGLSSMATLITASSIDKFRWN